MKPTEVDTEFWTLAAQFNPCVDKSRPTTRRRGALAGVLIALAVEAAAAAAIIAAIIIL